MNQDEKTNIVKVKFESIYDPKTFAGREYTYYCNLAVNIGDIVIAPTSLGESNAIISSVNVSESEIEHFKDRIKTITQILDKEEFINGTKD